MAETKIGVKNRDQEVNRDDENVKAMQDFTSPEVLYKELIDSVHRYHPSTDISMIEKAYKIAYEAHKGQMRKSVVGDTYLFESQFLSTRRVFHHGAFAVGIGRVRMIIRR